LAEYRVYVNIGQDYDHNFGLLFVNFEQWRYF